MPPANRRTRRIPSTISFMNRCCPSRRRLRPPRKRKPTPHFMLAHPAHWIAQGFGSALAHHAGHGRNPLAWLSYAVLSTRWPHVFTAANWLVIIAAGFIIGIGPATARAGAQLAR
jgi:hypothetical protein